MATEQETNNDLSDDTNVEQLGMIVQQEAHRILSSSQLEADSRLVAAGWERRFISDGRRAREMVDLYSELGYDVHLEPVKSEEFEDDCEDCSLVALMKFVTIYTRRKD